MKKRYFFPSSNSNGKKLNDYKEAMFKAVMAVAKVENKSVEQVMLYLLNPNTDILKIRLEKTDIEAGNILFNDAIRMYENAKKFFISRSKRPLKD